MTTYIGRLLTIGMAKESSRGSGADPTYLIPDVSFSFDDKVVKARETAGIGSLADSDNAFVTTKYGAGDLEGEIRSKSFGLLLYNLMGSLSSSGAVDEAYTHTFSLSETNNHQSLSITVNDPNTKEQYKLVMLDKLEIVSEVDDIVKYTASFMSKKGDASTVDMPSLVSESKFTKKHLSLKLADSVAGLSGASAISVKSLTLTVTKNAELYDPLGTAEPEDIYNKSFSVEGELTINYTDETYKNYMRDGTKKSMQIAFTNTDETLGGGSTNPSLTFVLPLVDFFEWEADYSLDEIVSQTFSFKANYDVANSLQPISSIALVNDVASY